MGALDHVRGPSVVHGACCFTDKSVWSILLDCMRCGQRYKYYLCIAVNQNIIASIFNICSKYACSQILCRECYMYNAHKCTNICLQLRNRCACPTAVCTHRDDWFLSPFIYEQMIRLIKDFSLHKYWCSTEMVSCLCVCSHTLRIRAFDYLLPESDVA